MTDQTPRAVQSQSKQGEGARPVDWFALVYGLMVIATVFAGIGVGVWLVVA